MHDVTHARAAALAAAQQHAERMAALAQRAAKPHRSPAAGCFGRGLLGACFPRARPTAAAAMDLASLASPATSAPRAPGRFGLLRRSSSVAAPAENVPLDAFDADDCGVPPLPQESEVLFF